MPAFYPRTTPYPDTENAIVAGQLWARLEEIEATIYSQHTPIKPLKACVTGPDKGPERPPKKGWQPFALHERWGGFDQTTWFKMAITVPAAMKGKRVVAFLKPGGEALVYVNGVPHQGVDKFHETVYLTDNAKTGQKFELLVEGVPSVRFDEYHNFERAEFAVMNTAIWDFYWDCCAAFEVWKELSLDSSERKPMLDALNAIIKSVDLQHKNTPQYDKSIAAARVRFQKEMKQFATSHGMIDLYASGHSHIDSAWLWPLRETHRKCSRTFATMLNLMDQYPDFRFICGQAVQYEWIRDEFPELYTRIKQRVKEGRWEPFGAMYVEPDCNVPSAESLIRQLLYGIRFFEKEMGVRCRTVWLPDAFGYNYGMPQILKKCGIETFVTTKISWSHYTEFPYDYFQWEGADGSRIRGLMPTRNYNQRPYPEHILRQQDKFKQKEKVAELPYCFGAGDGGGGPTADEVERVLRLGNIAGMPKIQFGSYQACIDRMKAACPMEDLPVWNGELYLEFHRACQTTQSATKRMNRKCEVALREAEFISTMAMITGGDYDAQRLMDAWKIVLLNQFHDILPGSSVNEVYRQTAIDYAKAIDLVEGARNAATNHLIDRIDTSGEGTPIVVFNNQSWVRDDVAEVSMGLPRGDFSVVDGAGNPVAWQKLAANRLLIAVAGVPPMGYAVYRLVKGKPPVNSTSSLKASATVLENDCLRVRFDKAGAVRSIYDKQAQREVIAEGQRGNVLQLFDDRPHRSDAWDFDWNFEQMPLPAPALQSVQVVEQGPLRAVVRFEYKTEHSTICQDVTLHAGSRRLDFVTRVDWNEKRVLMKVAFPVDVRASRATYEVQCATVERPTHVNTAADKAQFEVPAQRWADLSEGDYGVSLLNDCKYGYDIRQNTLRLSLLRAPIDPDPYADEGTHEFTYSLYPHEGTWRDGTIENAAALNDPLRAVAAEAHGGSLPAAFVFASVDADNVIIDTIKKSEDDTSVIVRLYEALGSRGPVELTFGRAPKSVCECDLMEENEQPVKVVGHFVRFDIKPYEIRTLKVVF